MASLQPGALGHVLQNQGITGGFGTSMTWTCISETSTLSLYRYTGDVGAGVSAHDIKFVPGTGWLDAGSSDPNKFRAGQASSSAVITPPVTATQLFLFNSAQFLTALTTNYTSSPGSGRTGMSVNNSGTATLDNFGTLSFIVSAGSNSSETYSISLGGVDKFTITPNGVPPWYKNYTFAEHSAIGYGEWILYDQAGPLATITTTASATPPPANPAPTTTTTTLKKVFCNFW